jgi:MFS family permease
MLSALDTSIVATAMPRIIADLSGLEFSAWVTTAYLVTSTTIIPISGKLADPFGRKRVVQGGMIGFLIASALCGLAQSMPQLVAARAPGGLRRVPHLADGRLDGRPLSPGHARACRTCS